MPKLENRSQLMGYLGAQQRNTVWSWCAVDHEDKKVYFSLWDDTRQKRDGDRFSYLVQEPHWGIDPETGRVKPARRDHDEKLDLAFAHGYEVFGYVVVAKDIKVVPREIEETKTGFVFALDLERVDNGSILGYPTTRINIR